MKQINNYIIERLRINKDTGKDNIFSDCEEYWFNDEFGVKLPFTLRVSGRPNAMDIEIYSIKQIQKRTQDNRSTEVWGLYDENNKHIINIYHSINGTSTLNALLKFNRHTIIASIMDLDLSKKLKKESTVVKYKDSESKILIKGST